MQNKFVSIHYLFNLILPHSASSRILLAKEIIKAKASQKVMLTIDNLRRQNRFSSNYPNYLEKYKPQSNR